MIKHIIIWTLKEDFSPVEKTQAAEKIKSGLEGLAGKIEGLISIKVQTKLLESSAGDLMLDSEFADVASLKAYQTNPLHLSVAEFVRSCVSDRKCADFEI